MEGVRKRKTSRKSAEKEVLREDGSSRQDELTGIRTYLHWMHIPVVQWFTPFHIVLLSRIISVFMVNTFYVPDEYWQALEVAHHQVFGYGYLTWEWKKAIRSYLYPSVFAMIYKALELFHLDFVYLLIQCPRIFQAFLTCLTDAYTYGLTNLFFGHVPGCYALFFQASSWFLFYTGSRTLSNTIEMTLSTIGLFYVLSTMNNRAHRWYFYVGITLGIVSCIIRPTAGIIWLPILCYVMFHQRNLTDILFHCFGIVMVALIVFAITFFIDMYFYGRPVIPSLNFLKFNVLQNLSGFYGSHPWHWYLLQGIPVTLGPQLLPVLVGLWSSYRRQTFLVVLILIEVGILSLISHKEFRFLLPVLPICFCFAGQGAKEIKDFIRSKSAIYFRCWQVFLVCGTITNCIIGVYTGLLHQRGTLDAVHFLAQKATKDSKPSFLFLMPCHSTPFYSHIHKNVTMRFLECHPNFTPEYKEEADMFYENPNQWLSREYPNTTGEYIPTDIILFDPLQENIKPFLTKLQFKECARFFHTQFPSERVGRYVVIYCRPIKEEKGRTN